jgi:hypothetical protein
MQKRLRELVDLSISISRKVLDRFVKHIRLHLFPRITWYYSRDGVLAVDICTNQGIGAKLEWCLEIMAYCDTHNLLPQFKFSYPTLQLEDYFSSFFSIKGSPSKSGSVKFVRIHDIRELGLDKNYDEILTLELATHLIDKYLSIKEDVFREVGEFCSRYFYNQRVLGIHYRGTDKATEAPFVPYEKVKRNADYYLEQHPETTIVFIASDDLRFITYMNKCFKSRSLIMRDDSFRSQDDHAVHHRLNINRYEMNRDAVVNCLILSRCDALIKTASILSDWSKLFNPELSIVILNQSYDRKLWFPARMLKNEALYEAIE